MNKFLNYLLIILIAASLILIYLVSRSEPMILKHEVDNCQYSERPRLADGSCDNSDPCDPERIKIDGGKCEDDPTVEPEKKLIKKYVPIKENYKIIGGK